MSALAFADARFALGTAASAAARARPIADSSGVWRCWCGAARANPYGRPTFNGRLRLEDCDSCGDLVITGTNYDAAKAMKAIIDKHL